MHAERPCAECGKLFIPEHGLQLCCSPECKRKRNSATNHKNYLFKNTQNDHVCAVCGAPYHRRGTAKTCSPECSRKRKATMDHKRYIREEDVVPVVREPPKLTIDDCVKSGQSYRDIQLAEARERGLWA